MFLILQMRFDNDLLPPVHDIMECLILEDEKSLKLLLSEPSVIKENG